MNNFYKLDTHYYFKPLAYKLKHSFLQSDLNDRFCIKGSYDTDTKKRYAIKSEYDTSVLLRHTDSYEVSYSEPIWTSRFERDETLTTYALEAAAAIGNNVYVINKNQSKKTIKEWRDE